MNRESQDTPSDPRTPPQSTLTPLILEFKYRMFAFRLGEDGECEPKKVAEYLTDNAAGGWLPRQVSESVDGDRFVVSVLLARAKPRKVVPVM